jgi:hypothetical protein
MLGAVQNGNAVLYSSSVFNLDLTSALLFPLVSGVFVDRALPLDRFQSDRVRAGPRYSKKLDTPPRRRTDTVACIEKSERCRGWRPKDIPNQKGKTMNIRRILHECEERQAVPYHRSDREHG